MSALDKVVPDGQTLRILKLLTEPKRFRKLTSVLLLKDHSVVLIHPVCALQLDPEDCVGPGAPLVHVGGAHLARLLALLHPTKKHNETTN